MGRLGGGGMLVLRATRNISTLTHCHVHAHINAGGRSPPSRRRFDLLLPHTVYLGLYGGVESDQLISDFAPRRDSRCRQDGL
jgi:hypothetical protein